MEFKQCQLLFDKRLRFYKRRSDRGLALHVEHLQIKNPQLFWREINKLGPRKDSKIPMEMMLENGDLEHKVDVVLNKWENDFEALLSGNNNPGGFDIKFLKIHL